MCEFSSALWFIYCWDFLPADSLHFTESDYYRSFILMFSVFFYSYWECRAAINEFSISSAQSCVFYFMIMRKEKLVFFLLHFCMWLNPTAFSSFSPLPHLQGKPSLLWFFPKSRVSLKLSLWFCKQLCEYYEQTKFSAYVL